MIIQDQGHFVTLAQGYVHAKHYFFFFSETTWRQAYRNQILYGASLGR